MNFLHSHVVRVAATLPKCLLFLIHIIQIVIYIHTTRHQTYIFSHDGYVNNFIAAPALPKNNDHVICD